nr:ATP-binding protein [Pseudomonas congelans]
MLLHDSAMCWQAYENGREGVRASVEWRDAYAHECDQSPDLTEDARQAAADFAALRALHAHQAQKLLEIGWKHPDTGQTMYLIDDILLRTELGPLAGNIASSHHWNTEVLSSSLGEQFNAPFPLPSEWSVDPVKIACLLRCADAAHINPARAPLFLYALIKRQGVSLEHWKAQNRIMGPSPDTGDRRNTAVIYTSSRSFLERDAAAWWVAYDAVSTVAHEIASCNELLRNRTRQTSPEFKVKRVSGSESIEDLVRYLRVEGWMPCGAKPHVSNVESLVKELGGQNLYGKGLSTHTFAIVLREMIQNARDAVVARRFIEPGFEGEVFVRFTEEGQISVEDNGTGMSRKVMTGPLLDFGNSFWKSSLVQAEFPGLRASKFRSIGRFGVGFYSIFMISDFVEVSSRYWDKGLADVNTLVFNSGVSLRPILRSGRVNGFSSNISTKVTARLKPEFLSFGELIKLKPNYSGAKEFECTLEDFISALTVGLDVPVRVAVTGNSPVQVHDGRCADREKAGELLRRISFLSNRDDFSSRQYIDGNHHRLRPIKKGDETVVGMAAISTHSATAKMLLGLRTVGGLPTAIGVGSAEAFIGYMDYLPASAKRDLDIPEATKDVLRAWGTEQLEILEREGASDYERCIAAAYLADYDVDPINFARVYVTLDGESFFISYQGLAVAVATGGAVIGLFKSSEMDFVDTYTPVNEMPGINVIRPLANSKSCNLKMVNGEPEIFTSIIGCLHRAILEHGKTPKWELRKTNFPSIFGGSMIELLVVSAA